MAATAGRLVSSATRSIFKPSRRLLVARQRAGVRHAGPIPRAGNPAVARAASSAAGERRRSGGDAQAYASGTTGGAGDKPVCTLFPGDGVGPEIADAVLQVFEAAGDPVTWERHHISTHAVTPTGDLIPEAAMASVLRNRVALKGPFTTPIGMGHRSLNLALRQKLELYANVRLCRNLEGVASAYESVDLVAIRENTEGEYGGLEHEVVPGVVENIKVITRAASERIARFAFEYATANGRRTVSAVHKAGFMKLGDGLFLECCREAAENYPFIKYEEQEVDNLMLQLVLHPEKSDVLLMPNLYGDIASDLAAGVVGGLAVVPSANIGDNAAVFETVHGTAPDIVGLDVANPSALILASCMMLKHVGLPDEADRIEQALLDVIAIDKIHTVDLGGAAAKTARLGAMAGALRRYVYLLSSNKLKVREFERAFAPYGITVLRQEPFVLQAAPPLDDLHSRSLAAPAAAGGGHGADAPGVGKVGTAEYMLSLLRGDGVRADAARLGVHGDDRVRVLALLAERSSLYEHGTQRDCDPGRHLARVDHVSRMLAVRVKTKKERAEEAEARRASTEALTAAAGDVAAPAAVAAGEEQLSDAEDALDELAFDRYEARTEGYLDQTNRHVEDGSSDTTFGWDDVFNPRFIHRPFAALWKEGYKFSARDDVLSQFIAARVHYRRRVDWRWTPRNARRTIDFGREAMPATFFASNPHLVSPQAEARGIRNAWTHTVNSGVFFRSAKTRREKTYWWPNLAGLPLTPKRDAVHELCFHVHDIGHYNVPDLTYAGTEGTDTERRVYTAWRMLSEAVTLSQADMAFVDGLRASGVEYDWTKRKIYPLYQDTGIDLSVADDADDPIAAGRAFRERARTLVRANVDYCLHGDDSTYRRLIADAHGGASGEYPDGLSPALTAFKEKYMPFFVEDFRWTAANWHDMVLRKEEFARWWEPVSALREPLNLQMLSVADCMKLAGITEENGPSMDARELVSRVLAVLDQECLSRGWLSETPLELVSTEIQLLRAFGRWLMGSLMLFARYHFLHDSPVIQTKLVDFILSKADGVTQQEVADARSLYEQFVDTLAARSLVSSDDRTLYREVFPLINPAFVHYDLALDRYPSLAAVGAQLLEPGRLTSS